MLFRWLWNSTEWDENGEALKLRDEYKDTKAFAQDGSDYRADVLTRPDFGCVSHQAEDIPTANGDGDLPKLAKGL